MKLKASKTRLYNLVLAHYPDLPPLRKTEFRKTPRTRSYWLDFNTPEGCRQVYLSAVCGRAVLSVRRYLGDSNWEYNTKTIWIPLDELKKFDLLDKEVKN